MQGHEKEYLKNALPKPRKRLTIFFLITEKRKNMKKMPYDEEKFNEMVTSMQEKTWS